MTHQVKKSVADFIGDFPKKVDQFSSDLSAWAAHMQRVATDAGNLRLKDHERHAPYPRPTAHPDIEQSVAEDGRPDFEIVDDGPPPEVRLAMKKNELLAQVSMAEQAAIDNVVSPPKRRYFEIRRAEINHIERQAEADRVAGRKSAKPMSKEDREFAAADESRRSKVDAIIRKAAKMHHDIDDLTLDNIDAWKMGDLS